VLWEEEEFLGPFEVDKDLAAHQEDNFVVFLEEGSLAPFLEEDSFVVFPEEDSLAPFLEGDSFGGGG
jgi:hypothetical protein